jgi:hypothetical protein
MQTVEQLRADRSEDLGLHAQCIVVPVVAVIEPRDDPLPRGIRPRSS